MLDEKMTRLTPLRLWILLVKVKKKTRECLLDRCLEDGTSSPLTSQPDTTPSPAAEARLWGAWRASTSCTPSLRWDWDTSLPAPFPDVPPVCRRPLPSPEAPPLGDTVCSAGETGNWEEVNLYFFRRRSWQSSSPRCCRTGSCSQTRPSTSFCRPDYPWRCSFSHLVSFPQLTWSQEGRGTRSDSKYSSTGDTR